MPVARGAWLTGIVLVAASAAQAAPAQAGPVEDARAYNDRATAAFALARYAEAAGLFESAFELKPDPGLLHNAALAHRLAGNRERALSLYQNYLRVYGNRAKGVDIGRRIDELKRAIERDRGAAIARAGSPAGLRAAPPPAEASPIHVTRPASATTPRDERPLTAKPWFWAAVGGGSAAAAAVVLLLALGGPDDPSPSIGRLSGN